MSGWTRILLALMIVAQPVVLLGAIGGDAASSAASSECVECEDHCPACEQEVPCSDDAECAMAVCASSPAFLMTDPYVITSAAEALRAPEPLACEAGGIPPLLLRPPIYA